jgi:hypothetical protein
LDIKPNTTVELRNGIKGKVIGQLEDGRYMVKGNKKGQTIYCQEKDIVSVEK